MGTTREQELNATLDPLPIPAYVFSYTERRFIAANGIFCDLVGYSVAELRAMDWRKILPPDEVALAEKALVAASTHDFPAEPIRWRFRCKDGPIIVGTAKIREMLLVSNQGDQMGCHFVAIVATENEQGSRAAADAF